MRLRFRPRPETVGQLRVIKAVGLDRIARRGEFAVAGKLSPAPVRPIRRGGRAVAMDDGGAALPQNRVRCRPTRLLRPVFTIAKTELVAVDAHVVIQHAARPTVDRTALVERAAGEALHEGVWPGGTEADREVM